MYFYLVKSDANILPKISGAPEILGESSLSHILGYTGKISESELSAMGKDYSPIDYIGKTGIEYFGKKN